MYVNKRIRYDQIGWNKIILGVIQNWIGFHECMKHTFGEG